MHAEEQFTNPPPRRSGQQGLFRDPNNPDAALLICKKYKKEEGNKRPWGLPGGCADEGENSQLALLRELREELGIEARPSRILAVHQMPARGDSKEGHNYIWSCAPIPDPSVIRLPEHELSDWKYVHRDQLHEFAEPYTVQRITEAMDVEDGTTSGAVFLFGHPDTAAA